jgi:hypothetical protein
MRLPRVRFTVRRMMVSVAVASSCVAAYLVATRGGEFREEAIEYLQREQFRVKAEHYGHRLADLSDIKVIPGHPDPLHRRREYYDQMRKKYERAARYPWLPVAPDPPEPE